MKEGYHSSIKMIIDEIWSLFFRFLWFFLQIILYFRYNLFFPLPSNFFLILSLSVHNQSNDNYNNCNLIRKIKIIVIFLNRYNNHIVLSHLSIWIEKLYISLMFIKLKFISYVGFLLQAYLLRISEIVIVLELHIAWTLRWIYKHIRLKIYYLRTLKLKCCYSLLWYDDLLCYF